MKMTRSTVSFSINGKPYEVNAATTTADTSLNTFLRTTVQLRGTKFMCLEGGCGACIVSVRGVHPVDRKVKTWSVNSCLTPILACDGLEITTVEGVGNRLDGYNIVQKRLTEFSGTQCGYCSPGMVMNMHSLLEANDGSVTMAQVENSFGGNICRCTGYRPILDAFKSLAVDADAKLLAQCNGDIEDLPKKCPSTGKDCAGTCRQSPGRNVPVKMDFKDSREWVKVYTMNELFDVLTTIGGKKYMLVAGNTSHGVYRNDADIEVYIHVNDIEELRLKNVGAQVVLGGLVSLTETMEFLAEASAKPGFEYCSHLVSHVDLIANVPVRNAGTIAGNLSIKHAHREFPSDMYLMLETAGAKLTIGERLNKSTVVSVEEYLQIDMRGKVILNVILPALDPSIYTYRSYKIMPRAQNAHAYVNAGFLLEVRNNAVASARICFGGIDPSFTHAHRTEKHLIGKRLHSNQTLNEALDILKTELNPDWVLPDASPEYRRNLALSLFYKFVLGTSPSGVVQPEYLSGGAILSRPLSSGKQTTVTVKENWPLTQPIPKYEGLIQCSGEVEYVNDIPAQPNELWAAFVPATVVHAVLRGIDATNVLKLPGVHFVYTAADIPGINDFYPNKDFGPEVEEVLLSVGKPVLFHGQPVAIVLADTFSLANSAAKKVEVLCEKVADKPIVTTLHDAHYQGATHLYADTPFKAVATKYGDATDTVNLSGDFDIGTQYHYTMEAQSTICIPAEDGIDVFAATQWTDVSQQAVADVLNIPNNAVNMQFRRIGGGYGAKITRSFQTTCASALACYLSNRPVRFVLSIESNMATVGRRTALLSEYSVEADTKCGRIQRLNNSFAQDCGSSLNDGVFFGTMAFLQNCYNNEAWDIVCRSVVTNAPCHTFCRAPGSTEAIALTETIMEHIARQTGLDPVDVRLANMNDANPIKKLLPEFVEDVEFYKRKQAVNEFNAKNRWRKRGIAVVPMDYPQEYFGSIPVFVAIYHADGTVVVTHGGIECGQGINTKAAQTAAFILGIPYELVKVKKMDNVVGANAGVTGGSMTSEAVCHAIRTACTELVDRLKPFREENPDHTWPQLIRAAYAKMVDLTAKALFRASDLKTYHTYGISCAEVEIDLLTGNLQLVRVDILEDTGESLSPNVDLGQVEGAFVMGLGYWLTEAIIHDPKNGELLTNRTWHYKPPGAKDIPVDFRVKFLQNSKNEFGVLRSKATGEPPLCMSIVVVFALRHALDSARIDAGINTEKWYDIPTPATPEALFMCAGNSIEQYVLSDKTRL